jgi:uncharacterized protein with beta-barrel porin domain
VASRIPLKHGKKIELSLRSAWMREFQPNQNAVTPSLNAAPGTIFQVNGAQTAADALVVVMAKWMLSDRVRLFGKFDSQFSNKSRGYIGTAGVQLGW